MKINVLFVDDEVSQIKELKKIFSIKEKEWGLFFVSSGEEALNVLTKNALDVIVTDSQMPNMDGIELLRRVRDRHPHLLRLIISSQSDINKVLPSTQYAHQILLKPYDYDNLKLRIEKTFFLRNYLNNKNLQKIINGIGNLPSLPELYLKLQELVSTNDISMQKVGEVISQDIAMTAKVLQLVNSGFFSLAHKISDPMQAASFLGMNIIKSLVLYIKIFTSYVIPADTTLSMEFLWHHSLRVAHYGRELLKLQKISDRPSTDDAYVAGILHDIGKLTLANVPDYYRTVRDQMKVKDLTFMEAEYHLFGTSHAEVGAYLLGVWELPHQVVEAVAFHHNPSIINETKFSVISALHIANAMDYFVPFIDLKHIKDLKIENKLTELIDCCKRIRK